MNILKTLFSSVNTKIQTTAGTYEETYTNSFGNTVSVKNYGKNGWAGSVVKIDLRKPETISQNKELPSNKLETIKIMLNTIQ